MGVDTLGEALASYTMEAVWAQVGTLLSLSIVIGLVTLGFATRYGKRIIRFLQSL